MLTKLELIQSIVCVVASLIFLICFIMSMRWVLVYRIKFYAEYAAYKRTKHESRELEDTSLLT